MIRITAALFVVAVSSYAMMSAYAVSFIRSWESCNALAEERGFIGAYTRGRRYKARFVRNCRLGTQI